MTERKPLDWLIHQMIANKWLMIEWMQRDGPVRTVRNRHAASTAAVTADVRLHLASVIQAGPENSVKNVFAIHGNNLQRIFKRSTTLPPPQRGSLKQCQRILNRIRLELLIMKLTHHYNSTVINPIFNDYCRYWIIVSWLITSQSMPVIGNGSLLHLAIRLRILYSYWLLINTVN